MIKVLENIKGKTALSLLSDEEKKKILLCMYKWAS